MLLFPPFIVDTGNDSVAGYGYNWFLIRPESIAIVNVELLLVQFTGVALAAGMV
jgi:hypothetical protein